MTNEKHPDDVFIYDETAPSCLRWKVRGKGKIRDYAGTLNKEKGYWASQLNGRPQLNKDIIWKMHYGEYGYNLGKIVFLDGDRSNVKVGNLKLVTFQELELPTLLMKEKRYKELFDYRDGNLYWKMDRFSGKGYNVEVAKKGDQVHVIRDTRDGYLLMPDSNNGNLRVHRVVYEMHFGEIPEGMMIDHINGIITDNRIENLRVVDSKGNGRNMSISKRNTTGVAGVFKDERKNAYRMTYRDLNGKERSRSFSISKYGDAEALRLTIEARVNAIKNLNGQGAGYTDRHYLPSEVSE